jgi:predicted acylesterase/phospholipase RssA
MPAASRFPLALLAVGVSAALVGGCTLSPFREIGAAPPTAVPAEPTDPAKGTPPRILADDAVTERESADGMFVGLALSGGGSRAAVFAAEVIRELDRLGLMSRVDYVSCVSGGSIAGTYYCLSRDPSEARAGDLVWEGRAVAEAMTADMAGTYEAWSWSPLRMARYLFTGANRSALMAEVMDATVFRGRTLADLNPKRPRLLINTTRVRDGTLFLMAERQLRELGLEPGRLAAADSVQASCAFPGIFQPRALPRFSRDPATGAVARTGYCHLMDGGVHDNSGAEALLEIYDRNRDRFPKGAVILLVESGRPLIAPPGVDERADLRDDVGYVIDLLSAEMALDVILESNRLFRRAELEWRTQVDGMKVVSFAYPCGLLAVRAKAAAEGKDPDTGADGVARGLLTVPAAMPGDLRRPLGAMFDWRNWLRPDDIAPTALSITDAFAEQTRAAAREAVAEHAAELQAALGTPAAPAATPAPAAPTGPGARKE